MPMPNFARPSLDLGTLQFLGTYSYTGMRHPYIANLPAHEMPGYSQLNLRAAWRSQTGKWSATLWVSNASDEIGLVSFTPATIADGFNATGLLSNPRRIGFVLRYKL